MELLSLCGIIIDAACVRGSLDELTNPNRSFTCTQMEQSPPPSVIKDPNHALMFTPKHASFPRCYRMALGVPQRELLPDKHDGATNINQPVDISDSSASWLRRLMIELRND